MHTCFSAPSLPDKEFIYEWAGRQTELSLNYQKTGIGMSNSPEGRKKKREMLSALDMAFKNRASLDLRTEYISRYRKVFVDHLEDPGTFENFRFFCVPESDEMIMFYLSIWTGDMASAMLYLHYYGKSLSGKYRFSPTGEAWRVMAENEGIAENERIKAESVAKEIRANKLQNICFFGGGLLPERLYDNCLGGKRVSLFETGPVTERKILLSPSSVTPPNFLKVYHDSLLNASKSVELKNSTDLVVMHGVSMYLGKEREAMATALKNAGALLRAGGIMMFDYLLMTEGMLRTATAQHWPGAKDMLIFKNPKEAILEANYVVNLANELGPARFYVSSMEITMNRRWGPTSVRCHIVKST